MKAWLSLVIAISVLFKVPAVAMNASESDQTYTFNADRIKDPEEVRKATEFCTSNPRNVVLVIDDTATTRKILRLRMHKEGYATFEFENGDDFLFALRHAGLSKVLVPNSRLAILDNQMPGTKGEDILEILKREELLKFANKNGIREVPVTLHTSDAPDLITKPVKYFVRKLSMPELFRIMNENNSPPTKPRALTF